MRKAVIGFGAVGVFVLVVVVLGQAAKGAPPRLTPPPQFTAAPAAPHCDKPGPDEPGNPWRWTDEEGGYWWKWKRESIVIPYNPGQPPAFAPAPRFFRPFGFGAANCGPSG